MFEENLVASQPTSVSTTKRWTMVGSTALQVAIAATLIVIPMLHPERLTFHLQTPLVFTPPPPRPPVPITQAQPAGSKTSTMPSAPVIIRSQIPLFINRPSDSNPLPATAISNGWAMGTSAIADVLSGTAGHQTPVSVQPTKSSPKPLKVSEGVVAGRLMTAIQPIYPSIALAAHVSGSVVVEAIISKAGTIESLHVISGPVLLRSAALDAIRVARYRPFLLNGEPTEVQTTITVNFTMQG